MLSTRDLFREISEGIELPLLDSENDLAQTGKVANENDEAEPRLPPRLIENLTVEAIRLKMRAARKRSGLTLAEVAERMGLAPADGATAVEYLLERDSDPGIFTVVKYAEANGMSVFDMLELPVPEEAES